MVDWWSTSYTLLLILLAAVAFALAFFGWYRRPAPGAVPFAVLMFAVSQWMFGYAGELGAHDLPAKVLWAQWQYPGIVIVPVAWLFFAKQVYHRSQDWSKCSLCLLAVVPLLTVVLVWTNELHHLVWRRIALSQQGPLTVLDVTYGPFFWVHYLYSQVLLVAGTVLLGRMVLHTRDLYRRQIIAVLFGALAPWIGNALYTFELSPVPHIDFGPFAFVATGIALAWSLLRFRLLSVGPIARYAIVEGMRDGVIVMDRNQLVVDVNPAAQQIVGQSSQTLVGRHVHGVLPAPAASVIQSNAAADTVQLTLPVAGEQRTYDVSLSELIDQRGQRAGQLLIFRDVTVRVLASTALQASEERYRIVSELTSDYAYVLSVEHDMTLTLDWVTDAFVRITGYTGAETQALGGWTSLVHPDDLQEARTAMRPVLTGQTTVAEFRIVTKLGDIRWLRSYNRPVFDDEKQRVVRVMGAGQDITERKETEAALRQQNEYFAALHDTSLAVINRLEVDDVLEAIVVRAGALVGTPHGYVYLVEPATDELVVHVGVGYFSDHRGYRIRFGEPRGLAGVVCATGQPAVVADYRTWPGRRPDLNDAPFRATVGLPLTSGTQVVGVLGLAYLEADRVFSAREMAILGRFAQLASIALDNARLYTTAQWELAERKRAEADLALARDQALEAARLKAEFLATMSHELRTPLNAIIGFTELTLDETTGKLDATQRSNLLRVSRNAHNLLELINGILDMSKIDAGRMETLDEDVFLDEVVQSAISNVETLVDAKRLQLLVHRSKGPSPILRGDAGRLRQIVLNLLSNAVKFTPEHGEITVSVEWGPSGLLQAAARPVDELPEGEWVALSVHDSGVGIQPEELERIWSEFYQIDSSATRQYGGTGLGLAIVKRLTLLMGGHVAVESVVGRGSTFTMWLPLRIEQELMVDQQGKAPAVLDSEAT